MREGGNDQTRKPVVPANLKFRYRPYLETDSPYDDPYTPGIVPARNEWYGRWVLVAPLR